VRGAIKVCTLWLSLAAISSRTSPANGGRTDGRARASVGARAEANYRIFEASRRDVLSNAFRECRKIRENSGRRDATRREVRVATRSRLGAFNSEHRASLAA